MNRRFLIAAAAAVLAYPAAAQTVPSSRRSRAAEARVAPRLRAELAAAGLRLGAPVFLRITKAPAELEVWVESAPGAAFGKFRTYPICAFSGAAGPKLKEGDMQAPEGFYAVAPAQMNPASQFHLSFNLGFPNANDRAHGRTGSALMVHGACVSIGCYAMTDPLIEEMWTLMAQALRDGQKAISVHAFPYRMAPPEVLMKTGDPPPGWRGDLTPEQAVAIGNRGGWAGQLGAGWAAFEASKKPPRIRVVGARYQAEIVR
ncbi:MAG: 2-dehydro-3-deoxyphosphooctonate aldolase [Caulobacterales bacterium]|jgi:murein L,D-transpeptidase YafK